MQKQEELVNYADLKAYEDYTEDELINSINQALNEYKNGYVYDEGELRKKLKI